MPEWSPEIVVTESMAQKMISSQFPVLAGLAVRKRAEGWDNIIFSAGPQWYFRFPRREVSLPGFQREIAYLERIAHRVKINVPRPEWVGTPDTRYPWPFYGYRPVPGEEICQTPLGEKERLSIALDLAAALGSLHSPETLEYLGEELPEDPFGRLDFSKRKTWALGKLENLKTRGESLDYEILERAVKDAALLERPPSLSVVHGDLHFRHILAEKGRFTGLIDWGDMNLSDPAVDLQIYWSFLPESSRPFFEEAYGPISDERKVLARGTAVYLNALLLEYGLHEGLENIAREARTALRLITCGKL